MSDQTNEKAPRGARLGWPSIYLAAYLLAVLGLGIVAITSPEEPDMWGCGTEKNR